MDYSTTYRENEELDDVLEEQLDDLHKDQYRTWNEKSEQLKQIRRQVEVIVRLRQAVNSRKPGDSIEIVSSAKPRRYSRQHSTVKKEEKQVDPIDVDEIARATKTQMRISQEREKFSSKNLFNVFRRTNGFGFSGAGMINHPATVSNNIISSNGNAINGSGNTRGGRLFVQRKSIIPNATSTGSLDKTSTADSSHHGAMRPRPETAHALKGYQGEIVASIPRRNRPKTAMDVARSSPRRASGINNPSGSRVQSARRLRSRRELEILCRMYSEAEEPVVDVDEVPHWEVVRENQRKRKLQQLQSQRQDLDLRVQRFLTELEQFNSPSKAQPSLLYDE